MRWLLNRVWVVGLMGGGLSACTPQSVAPIAREEAKVRTAAEARTVTVQQLQTSAAVQRLKLRLEAIEVQEQPTEWLVYVPFQRPMKPSGAYRVVDKQTGKVRVAVGL